MSKTDRDTSRDRHGLFLLGMGIGALALGPLGMAAMAFAGHKADEWVNENRDKYDPID